MLNPNYTNTFIDLSPQDLAVFVLVCECVKGCCTLTLMQRKVIFQAFVSFLNNSGMSYYLIPTRTEHEQVGYEKIGYDFKGVDYELDPMDSVSWERFCYKLQMTSLQFLIWYEKIMNIIVSPNLLCDTYDDDLYAFLFEYKKVPEHTRFWYVRHTDTRENPYKPKPREFDTFPKDADYVYKEDYEIDD